MLTTTLSRLRCPRCQGKLSLQAKQAVEAPASPGVKEVRSGELECGHCQARYPILAGVAVLVSDVGQYLVDHAKGVAKVVPDAEIPKPFRRDFLEAKAQIQPEHIEEDLEAERVTSLYVMNHYLSATGKPWWKPEAEAGSPLIDQLIREHWDHGPFARISQWVEELGTKTPLESVIELGCGVGGLSRKLGSRAYLGVDSSFASIALGRHLALGVPYAGQLRFPRDLLQGPVSADPGFPAIPPAPALDGQVDLVVGDLENLPVERGSWSLSIALNAIDMLPDPALLPRLQHELIGTQGFAIQSCPYVWHELVAKGLRDRLPLEIRDSAQAVEWLYEKEGFEIRDRVIHLPWLFFKHLRQLEIYSVHLFTAQKIETP